MNYVIIVAGGKGLRMGGEVPKQFLPVGGLPVLMRTILRFREYSADLRIILVLPKAQQDYWRQLCQSHQFPLPSAEPGQGVYQLADGGKTRFHSVQNGLALVPDDAEGVVGVHDGVRPFVAVEVIKRCYEAAREYQAAIPVVPVVETLRHVGSGEFRVESGEFRVENGERRVESVEFATAVPAAQTPSRAVANSTLSTLNSKLSTLNSKLSTLNSKLSTLNSHPSHTVPRDEYRLVQTPQCFDIQLLKAANGQPYQEAFTDDASVVEAYGHPVVLVEGNRENIKITTPGDLKIAETLAQ